MGKVIDKFSERTKKRVFLPEAIPLPTPFFLYLDPTNVCNFHCKFCPTGNDELLKKVKRKKEHMSFPLFTKIIDDISKFQNKIKLLNLFCDGEPLCHPQFSEICRYTVNSRVAERVICRTNGSLLTPALSEKLIASGLNEIGISIEGTTEEQYQEISSTKIDFDQLLKNLKYLFEIKNRKCRIYVKTIDFGLNEEGKKRFYHLFKPISDFCSIEHPMKWNNTGKLDLTLGKYDGKTIDGMDDKPKKICPFPFISCVIKSNGTVCCCCVDWTNMTQIGDLRKESLLDIWNGQKLYEFRKMLLEHRSMNNAACRNCIFFHNYPDSLDGYEALILKKLSDKVNF